jgi:hypothetical protein
MIQPIWQFVNNTIDEKYARTAAQTSARTGHISTRDLVVSLCEHALVQEPVRLAVQNDVPGALQFLELVHFAVEVLVLV